MLLPLLVVGGAGVKEEPGVDDEPGAGVDDEPGVDDEDEQSDGKTMQELEQPERQPLLDP